MVKDERTIALRDAVLRVFPAVLYTGKVTCHDGAWLPELNEENALHDDDMFLYEELCGRKWSDVPKEFVYQMPGEWVLLTDEALVAFLAAWLVCSLEDIEGENEVRGRLAYAFSPSSVPGGEDFMVSRLLALSPGQRAVVRSLLAEFTQSESSDSIRRHACAAVELIDSRVAHQSGEEEA